ncbi:MAG TPA: peptidoglycan-binding domain-containing protein [Pyrinomonadaceae bacterium]|nr:peptidoglycan-binding domain-containing protein [Pyrinomonadaceae bacterium]
MSLKTIKETVGTGGANIPADVATVQYLLNCVPFSMGGLIEKLKIDGFAGVLTIEAVNRFQRFHFGLSNSRVQGEEATFNELKKYDLSPFSAPVVTPNFNAPFSEKMDPSKMNRTNGKDIDGGTIKGRIYNGVKTPSI